MWGEAHYGLTDIKDVRVSREFVGLGETVTHCQTEEAGGACLSRKYQETVLTTCGCSPFNLRSHYGVGASVCSPSAPGLCCRSYGA